jgi:hypothetical protein
MRANSKAVHLYDIVRTFVLAPNVSLCQQIVDQVDDALAALHSARRDVPAVQFAFCPILNLLQLLIGKMIVHRV